MVKLLDLVMEIPPEYESKVLTKFFVFLRFSTFHNTVRAMSVLDNTVFNVNIYSLVPKILINMLFSNKFRGVL